MSDSGEDEEEVVNRFPRLDCQEIDALFEAVSIGKSRISRVQKRKVVREGKTLIEMTFKKEGGGGGGGKKGKGGKAEGGVASEEEVMTYLQSIVSGELTLDEFTVRNVLKGESYLRMELTSKADAEQQLRQQQQQQKTGKESSNKKAAEKKKSKKEIVDMENQLEFLQNKLAMMEKAKTEKAEMEALPVLSTARPTAAADGAVVDDLDSLTSTIERFTQRAATSLVRTDAGVTYGATPEIQSLEKKSSQIGSEIIALLKEAEALIASKDENEAKVAEMEQGLEGVVDLGQIRVPDSVVEDPDVAEVLDTATSAQVADFIQVSDLVAVDVSQAQELAIADLDLGQIIVPDFANNVVENASCQVHAEVDKEVKVTDTDSSEAVAAAAAAAAPEREEVLADVVEAVSQGTHESVASISMEDVQLQMDNHVASLEQESRDMEENLKRLIESVSSMAKQVNDKGKKE